MDESSLSSNLDNHAIYIGGPVRHSFSGEVKPELDCVSCQGAKPLSPDWAPTTYSDKVAMARQSFDRPG
jgi:hypothetical protein